MALVRTIFHYWIVTVVLTSLIMVAGSFPTPSFAVSNISQPSPWQGDCVGPDSIQLNSDVNVDASDVATIQGAECLVANVLTVAVTILGLVAFVMFIIGSFKWMVSGGQAKNVETARNTFTFAVVGLIVALSAVIVLTLIANFTGVNILTAFRITVP